MKDTCRSFLRQCTVFCSLFLLDSVTNCHTVKQSLRKHANVPDIWDITAFHNLKTLQHLITLIFLTFEWKLFSEGPVNSNFSPKALDKLMVNNKRSKLKKEPDHHCFSDQQHSLCALRKLLLYPKTIAGCWLVIKASTFCGVVSLRLQWFVTT